MQEHLPLVNDVISVQAFAHKKAVRLFMAVGNHLSLHGGRHAVGVEEKAVGGAEGDDKYRFANELVVRSMDGLVA